jgi:hypothetical protein
MNNKEAYEKLEQEKFRDEAVIYREREAAVASLNMSTFLTAIGPLAIFLLKIVNKLPVGSFMGYLILASAPIGLILTMVNYFRTPKDFRGSKLIVRAMAIAVAAAAATFVLAGYWGLMKKAVEDVEESP